MKIEPLTLEVNSNTSAEEIYKFLCSNVYWGTVIKLYRMLEKDIKESDD